MQGLAGHTVRGIAAVGAIIAAEAATMSSSDWAKLITQLGLAAALVVFFVATGWMREQRMAKRMDWLEKENGKLTARVATLAEQVNKALEKDANVLEQALMKLSERTCLLFRSREEFERVMEFVNKADKT